MKNIREAFDKHQPILVESGKQKGLLIGLDVKSIETLISLGFHPVFEHSCVLIADIGQLYDYVTDIPEIAWDIVEFEEKPLIIEYPKGKNLPDMVLNDKNGVSIMLMKEHPLTRQLYNFRQPVLWWPLNQNELSILDLQHFDYVLNLSKNPFDIFRPKRMKLDLDGEVKIF